MARLSRRDVLKLAGGMAMSSAFFPWSSLAGMFDGLFRKVTRPRTAITSNEEFYVTSYRSPADVRVDQWQLSIKGLVARPLSLNYTDLLARPSVSQIVTLECVGNGLAADAISTAEWKGVPLKALLEEVGVAAKAYDVVSRAADGYSDSIPVVRAMTGDVLLAHTMNGVPLPRGHGFPARLIVPGVYGMKSVQWLTEIELVDQDYQGYYQKKGWSDEANIKTSSHIDLPGHGETLVGSVYDVKGYAFAGTRGIRRVDISLDGGTTWQSAALESALSPSAWVFWSYRWALASPGRYTLVIRATDDAGQVQSSMEQDPYPDGAGGWHEITVTVKA